MTFCLPASVFNASSTPELRPRPSSPPAPGPLHSSPPGLRSSPPPPVPLPSSPPATHSSTVVPVAMNSSDATGCGHVEAVVDAQIGASGAEADKTVEGAEEIRTDGAKGLPAADPASDSLLLFYEGPLPGLAPTAAAPSQQPYFLQFQNEQVRKFGEKLLKITLDS